MKLVFSALLKSFLAHWVKGLFVVLALIIGISGLSSVLVINATAKQSYANATPPLFEQLQFRIKARQGANLTKQDYVQGRREGLNWVPVIEATRQLSTGQEVTLVGIDPFALNFSTQGELDDSIQPTGNVLLSRALAKSLGLKPGNPIILASGKLLGNAIISDEASQDNLLILDIAQLMSVIQHPEIDEFWLFNTPDSQQLKQLQNQYALESVYYEDPATLTDSFHLNLLAMGLLMFIVCLFIVMNAFHLLFNDRKSMLVMMRQMGVSRMILLKAIGLELLLLCLLCSVLGTVLGMQLAQWLSPAVELTLTSLYEVNVSLSGTHLFSLFVVSYVACLAGAIIALINPLLSLNADLANIRQHQHQPQSHHKFWFGLALLFATGFAVSSMLADSLLAHFIAVACLILLGCTVLIIMIPLLLSVFIRFIPTRQVLLHWAASDAQRIARYSKIAMCAFFIAVTANVGMNLMVDSFRQATTNWLEQRLVADFYLSTDKPEAIKAYFSQQHPQMWLWERKRLQAKVENEPVDVIAYPTHPDYQNAVGFKQATNDAWQRFLKDGVFVNEQLAYKQQLALGQTLRFYAGETLFTRTIVGIHYDYGNMDKQILMPDKAITQNQSSRFLFALHAPKDYPVRFETLSAELKAIDASSSVSDLQQIMNFSMLTFDKAFVVTGALNIITLLVAGASLATSITIIEVQNRAQSGLMRSLGVSKWRLTCFSLVQFAVLAILAGIVAIPFGALLSSILIYQINVASFAWSYPLLFNVALIAQVVGTSVIIVLLAVLLPLWRNHRKPIAQRLAQL